MNENKKTEINAHAIKSYYLTRIVLLRYVAFIYFIAFLVAYNQNEALIGSNGLLSVNLYLDRIDKDNGKNIYNNLLQCPTILWFLNYQTNLDFVLKMISLSGLILSFTIFLCGSANVFLLLILWMLYHSIVNVGQTWYSFGWESQLLETGFLLAFLFPFFSLKSFNKDNPPTFLVLFCFRWLLFRIMLGAGLIKIRGDKCWMDLTCMNYHYETQPVPNPISYYMHQEPQLLHKFEVLCNHFIELIAPFLLLMPRKLCIIGGIIQIFFQIVIIISGNLSFLNWLTIAPAIACFDDASLLWLFTKKTKVKLKEISAVKQQDNKKWHIGSIIPNLRHTFNICLILLIGYLSIPIIQNLMSKRQVMNTSFDPFRIVNTYGAFGSITKERTEVIFQGTHSTSNLLNPSTKWKEYEFKCKPGRISRRPCLISPYHYRLDWLMWFAAFQSYDHNPWLVHLGIKFLLNDNKISQLIAINPFINQKPPRWVRAQHYKYTFTRLGSNASNIKGHWWKRKLIGNYMPPISLDNIRDLAKRMSWKIDL